MRDEELDEAFREGRLSRRAYVRQLIDRGVDMQTALGRADGVVPATVPSATTQRAPLGPVTLSETPRRSKDLEVNFVGDGYVVYDRQRRRMHSMNTTAALVFELCTGEHRQSDIAELLQREYDLDDAPAAEVEGCLAMLAQERLIT